MDLESASTVAIRFGPFQLDPRAGYLRKGKTRLHLPPQPFKLLSLLVSRADQLVTREEIHHQLWDENTFVDFEQSLNVCIRQIRAALNDCPSAPRFVETVPRRGYRFVAPITKVAHFAEVDSLAVLPFENANGDTEIEYLCHGIAESLINTLSAVQHLSVVPRQTAFRFGSTSDLAKAARELNVRAAVSGRIILLGDNVNVQAELVDLETHFQLWGGQCSRKLSDIIELKEEISREICQHLRLRLSRGESRRLRKRDTGNPEAYQLYLKGRFCLEKRTLEGLHKAIEYLNQATQSDPRYSLAYAGLADAYTLQGSGTYGAMPSKNARARATEMAEKALEMDDTLAEAHTSLAFVRFRFDWAWQRAEPEFEQAIKLNPRYVTAHHWYALFLAAVGRHDEAIREIKKARQLDPLSLIVRVAEGRILHFARRFDDAIEQFHKVLDLDPNFIQAHCDLGASLEAKGAVQQALAEFETCVALSRGGPLYVASVAEAQARMGNKDIALTILSQLQASSDQYVSPTSIAFIYSSLGETDDAIAWQEKAFEERDASLAWANVAAESDALRSDPRFSDLLRRMKFPIHA